MDGGTGTSCAGAPSPNTLHRFVPLCSSTVFYQFVLLYTALYQFIFQADDCTPHGVFERDLLDRRTVDTVKAWLRERSPVLQSLYTGLFFVGGDSLPMASTEYLADIFDRRAARGAAPTTSSTDTPHFLRKRKATDEKEGLLEGSSKATGKRNAAAAFPDDEGEGEGEDPLELEDFADADSMSSSIEEMSRGYTAQSWNRHCTTTNKAIKKEFASLDAIVRACDEGANTLLLQTHVRHLAHFPYLFAGATPKAELERLLKSSLESIAKFHLTRGLWGSGQSPFGDSTAGTLALVLLGSFLGKEGYRSLTIQHAFVAGRSQMTTLTTKVEMATEAVRIAMPPPSAGAGTTKRGRSKQPEAADPDAKLMAQLDEMKKQISALKKVLVDSRHLWVCCTRAVPC